MRGPRDPSPDTTRKAAISRALGRRNRAVGVLFASLGGFLVAALFDAPMLAPVSWLVAAAGLFMVFRSAAFRCPQCGKPFFATWYWRNIFASHCLHCGAGG